MQSDTVQWAVCLKVCLGVPCQKRGCVDIKKFASRSEIKMADANYFLSFEKFNKRKLRSLENGFVFQFLKANLKAPTEAGAHC